MSPANFDEFWCEFLRWGVLGDTAVLWITELQGRTTQSDDLWHVHVKIDDKHITASNKYFEWKRLPCDHQLDALEFVE